MFDNFDITSKLDTFTISYIDSKEIAKDFLSFFPEGGAYPVREIGITLIITKISQRKKIVLSLIQLLLTHISQVPKELLL